MVKYSMTCPLRSEGHISSTSEFYIIFLQRRLQTTTVGLITLSVYRAHLNDFTFEKDYVYTFVSYQHVVSLLTFEFLLGFKNIDITRIISQIPLQIMTVYFDSDSFAENPPDEWKYFYNVEVWHEKCLENRGCGTEAEKEKGPSSVSSSSHNGDSCESS